MTTLLLFTEYKTPSIETALEIFDELVFHLKKMGFVEAYKAAHSSLISIQASKDVRSIMDQKKISKMLYWERINYERRQRNEEEE